MESMRAEAEKLSKEKKKQNKHAQAYDTILSNLDGQIYLTDFL